MPKLAATIVNYEMAIVPRSIFAIDGSLLVRNDNASLMKVIEDVPAVVSYVDLQPPAPANSQFQQIRY